MILTSDMSGIAALGILAAIFTILCIVLLIVGTIFTIRYIKSTSYQSHSTAKRMFIILGIWVGGLIASVILSLLGLIFIE
jgi:hypothetical protein